MALCVSYSNPDAMASDALALQNLGLIDDKLLDGRSTCPSARTLPISGNQSVAL